MEEVSEQAAKREHRPANRPAINRQRISLLLWCLLCLAVIFVLLPSLLLDGEQADKWEAGRPPVHAVQGWEIAFGPELPLEAPLPESSGTSDSWGWEAFDTATWPDLKGYYGTVWLQARLPELPWHGPQLFFSWLGQFDAYVEGRLVYENRTDRSSPYTYTPQLLHAVPLDREDAGKRLTLRMDWQGKELVVHNLAIIGEPDQLLLSLLQGELSYLLVSFLAGLAGMVGLLLFVRRKEALYGWFSLFGFSMGLTLLWSCRSLQWFANMAEIYYWLFAPAAIWAGIGFYANALHMTKRPLVRGAHAMMGVYIVASLCALLFWPELYGEYAIVCNAVAAFAGFVVGTWALIRYSRRAGSAAAAADWEDMAQERQWLRRGYWTFSLCMSVSLALSLVPGALAWLLARGNYLYRVFESLMANSLLLFIVCMIMVMVSRVRRVHVRAERNAAELLVKNRELEQFHQNLERLVEQRTAELGQANRALAITLREKAETLAEISVLEERNRISHEMHDVVGHTLTAAIVQLEATKKLADQKGLLLDKLDLLSELVRKGLNDIRKAVRLITSEEPPALPLEAALRELILYTEDTMEVAVASSITLPAGLSLGRVAEGVLYHALQEGLTNGIRHGRATAFTFSLYVSSEHMLLFELSNNGEAYRTQQPGFGLAAMAERIGLLGGTLSIGSARDEKGAETGCELRIALPIG